MAINSKNFFKVNQRLGIMLPKEKTMEQYSSRVEEVDEGKLIIAMPMSKGLPVMLENGGGFYAKVFAETGIYGFNSSLLQKRISPLPVWIVSIPKEMKKIQQRAFVRLDVSLPVTLEYDTEADDEPVLMKASTKDIGGGGLQLITEQPLQIGKNFLVYIELPDNEAIQAKIEIVRCYKPMEDRDLYWSAVKFVEINENYRDKIIRFIFRKQLEQRQKGM